MKLGLFLRALIAIAFGLLSLTACTASKPKGEKSITVYMGNPTDIVTGTVQTSRIPRDFFKQNDVFILQNQVEFKSMRSYNPKKENGESNAAVTDLSSSPFGAEFQYLEESNGAAALTSPTLKIFFTPTENGYEINSVLSKEKVYDTRLIHFSATTDKKVFSLLILDTPNSESLRTVTALYFGRYKNELKPADQIATRYNYTYGPGAKYRWPKEKEIEISLCQGIEPRLLPEIHESVEVWAEALEPDLKIKMVTAESAKPFSDLNQHCLSVVDGFQTNPNPKLSNYGATYTITDFETHTFVDVDVFLYRAEFQKRKLSFMSNEQENLRRRTLIHELGHFFGLEHPTGPAASIMSYDWALDNRLYPYDLQAVGALYAD